MRKQPTNGTGSAKDSPRMVYPLHFEHSLYCLRIRGLVIARYLPRPAPKITDFYYGGQELHISFLLPVHLVAWRRILVHFLHALFKSLFLSSRHSFTTYQDFFLIFLFLSCAKQKRKWGVGPSHLFIHGFELGLYYCGSWLALHGRSSFFG